MGMADSWFFDKNFNGVPDDFFDDAIKYFDLPLEDVEVNDEEEEDWEAKFQNLEPPPSNILEGLSGGVYGENSNTVLKVKNESLVSHDVSSQPSTGETFSGSIPLSYDSSEGKYVHQFRTSSPVSVLESSSSSCTAENLTQNLARIFVPVKRPRSKRSRLQRRIFPFISSVRAFKRFHTIAASDSESESYTDEKMSNSTKRRQKKRKNLTLLARDEMVRNSFSQPPVETRKCTHCGVSKTPQWREGPLGPKTLCNACGVRFRSGRLLPEYRPAASPTFIPSLHSNSHKKVLEMRKKAIQPISVETTRASFPPAPGY